MRKSLLLSVFAVVLTISPAHAQFCPGVTPWVFDDVPASDPFCGYITWAAENGITLGCAVIDANHRLYCPDANMSRSQAAAFVNRLGDVRVQAVDTGPGLVGGPITSVGTISLAATQLLPTSSCTTGTGRRQIADRRSSRTLATLAYLAGQPLTSRNGDLSGPA